MITTAKIYRLLEDMDPKLRETFLLIIDEIDKDQRTRVTQEEFQELRTALAELARNVSKLAESQFGVEQRLLNLEKAMEVLIQSQGQTQQQIRELINAQVKIEGRVSKLEKAITELVEAQRRTEKRVEELAEAQKRTEERLEELAEAQRRTDERLQELAQAQRRTEETFEEFMREHKKTREQVGGLSHAIGYRLEDEAIWALPSLLRRDYGIEVLGNLTRGYLELSPFKYIEVNIWGDGIKGQDRVAIVGEAKTQLTKKHVDEFMKRVKKIEDFVGKEAFPILITYHTSPQVHKLVREKGIALYFSYELRI